MLGTRLVEGRPVRSLSTAINAVYAMGHQTVIAQHCDLAGVADACAEIDDLAHAADRTALNLLFELGLAVSLALRLREL